MVLLYVGIITVIIGSILFIHGVTNIPSANATVQIASEQFKIMCTGLGFIVAGFTYIIYVSERVPSRIAPSR